MEKVLATSSCSKEIKNVTEKPHLEEVEEMKCPVCNSAKVSRCSGCNKVAYCSRQHQKADWKVHKSSCQAWKVFESKELGRYLIATRDIKPGEIVMEEKPLIIIPPRITPPLCLGCHIEFEDEEIEKGSSASSSGAGKDESKPGNLLAKPVPCPKNCGWPLCGSPECMASDYHQAECEAALDRGGVKVRHYEQEHPTYEAIGILRMLHLKKKNRQLYDELLKLNSSFSNSGSKESGSARQREDFLTEKKKGDMRIVNLVRDFFHVSDTSKDEILHLLGILEINGHEIPAPTSGNGHINRHFIGVFFNASFFEHNCIPNCVKTFPTTQDIVIRATGAIKRGDHLSISYVDPLWGTFDRVNFLQMSKNFTCKCTRCLDPTELGTHTSSLRCQKIKCLNRLESGAESAVMEGLVIPEEPYNPEGSWKCLTCGEDYSTGYVSSIVENVGRELDALHQSYGNIEAEEEFVKKYSKMLSPNHFYLLEIKLELAQIYGRLKDMPLPLLPPKKLARKRQLCEELLKVFNVISPGWNRLRAIVLYELQATVSTLSKLKRALEEISAEMHRQELLLCIAWLREAVQIFSWEPETSVERRRGEGAFGELMEMQELVMSLS